MAVLLPRSDMPHHPAYYPAPVHGDDDDGSDSDTSEDVVELSPDEIPAYFEERGGRLFHSHGYSPYPLPVDAPEHQRQNGLNQLLHRLIGASSVGPVRDLLAYAPGEQQRVLDLGTGTGSWVLDMAREYPHVRFYGVDIVPIATRYPPRNVTFEMHDIMDRSRYPDGAMDMVHARSISMATSDYSALLPEIARVLRPGGLFVSLEWSRTPSLDDDGPTSSPTSLATRAPCTLAFFDALRTTLRERRGLEPVAGLIPALLRASGHFSEVHEDVYRMPVGGWPADPGMREMGRGYAEMLVLYARSMHAVLAEGCGERRADDLVEGYVREIGSVSGVVSLVHTVWARRR